MSNIWILTEGEYDSYYVVGAYSDLEAAIRAQDKAASLGERFAVEEILLDQEIFPSTDGTWNFMVNIGENGWQNARADNDLMPTPMKSIQELYSIRYQGVINSDSPTHAIEIAKEQIEKLKG